MAAMQPEPAEVTAWTVDVVLDVAGGEESVDVGVRTKTGAHVAAVREFDAVGDEGGIGARDQWRRRRR